MKHLMYKKYCYSVPNIFKNISNNFSTKLKIVAELPTPIRSEIESNTLKPRHHPGVIKTALRALPPQLEKSIVQIIKDTPIKQLIKEANYFNSYLLSRQLPPEQNEIQEKRMAIQREVEDSMKFNKNDGGAEGRKHYDEVVNSKVTNILKQRLYRWKSIDYTRHTGLTYLFARGSSEYAVLTRVFNEILLNSPDFKPKTLFDFGSGVGSVIWAAETIWPKNIEEYFCVDISSHMHEIASQIIERSGLEISNKVFQRQFLPASYEKKYDIVVSAYSFMELPSVKSRLETLINLWNKTSKYLVLVERGSNAYFKIISDARDFILMNETDESSKVQKAYIVAPCPHEFNCPRLEADHTPCNFHVRFDDSIKNTYNGEELFTYIIFAKGERMNEDEQWPRVVRPVLIRSRHAVCKLCTSSGRLEQITFSKTKPNRATYRCAKASKWGDLLPVNIRYITESSSLPSEHAEQE